MVFIRRNGGRTARHVASLSHFAITRDESKLVPYFKSAQKYMSIDNSSKHHLFASAWSPPVWMKQNGHYSCDNAKPCALIQTAEVQQVYAEYLSKVVSTQLEDRARVVFVIHLHRKANVRLVRQAYTSNAQTINRGENSCMMY